MRSDAAPTIFPGRCDLCAVPATVWKLAPGMYMELPCARPLCPNGPSGERYKVMGPTGTLEFVRAKTNVGWVWGEARRRKPKDAAVEPGTEHVKVLTMANDALCAAVHVLMRPMLSGTAAPDQELLDARMACLRAQEVVARTIGDKAALEATPIDGAAEIPATADADTGKTNRSHPAELGAMDNGYRPWDEQRFVADGDPHPTMSGWWRDRNDSRGWTNNNPWRTPAGSNESKMRESAPPAAPERRPMGTFRKDLRRAINCASMENGSSTPDFILAQYLASCLAAFDMAVTEREKHGLHRLQPEANQGVGDVARAQGPAEPDVPPQKRKGGSRGDYEGR